MHQVQGNTCGRAVALGIRDKRSWAWLARRRATAREPSDWAQCTLGLLKGTSLARLARYAKKPLVVLEGLAGPNCACRACLTFRYGVASIGGVARACVAPARGRIVKEPIVRTRIVPQVLIVLAAIPKAIRNEDIVDAVAIEVARRATV